MTKVTSESGITLVTLQNCPPDITFCQKVFTTIADLGVIVDMISIAPNHGSRMEISFTICDDDLGEILEIEQKCIRKMGRRKGEIYLLYIHKGKTSKEISDMLNLSRRTVENHIFAARKIVREGLREAAG